MVKEFAAQCSDQPLDERVRQWHVRDGFDLLNFQDAQIRLTAVIYGYLPHIHQANPPVGSRGYRQFSCAALRKYLGTARHGRRPIRAPAFRRLPAVLCRARHHDGDTQCLTEKQNRRRPARRFPQPAEGCPHNREPLPQHLMIFVSWPGVAPSIRNSSARIWALRLFMDDGSEPPVPPGARVLRSVFPQTVRGKRSKSARHGIDHSRRQSLRSTLRLVRRPAIAAALG